MIIEDLFAKDINRSINGVVKVQQDDSASIQQELSEYVVTHELQKHFATFFDNYGRAIDVPTDKIGVWISGFFGSGKSHFLKMLSYLLANKEVAGKRAIDYFDGKMEDPFVYSQMRRCAEVPTEAILFNIDSKGGQWKEGETAQTALLRAFQRVFYESRGFYGEDLKLAKLEEHIDFQGKTQQFREEFQRLNGDTWEESRETYTYFEDDIVQALQQVLGWSEAQARNWFNGAEDDVIAADSFAQQVSSYVEQRAAENGGNFRLLFMVDEVGQFIGDDKSLMLNLQTLVEELGSRCKGRVWVMVTSQEAIDEVALVVGDDFSKIQGRFNTRLSLSSSSVDEVIKRRVLEKTPAAEAVLKNEYADQSAVLRNLFSFSGSRSDMGGFETETDFADSYPFVGYQFKLLPDVMDEIRKHGTKAQHMSTGERSMLSAFQESAQAVQNSQLSTLVPFWRFFDTVSKDLEHGIIMVIDRAERAAQAGQGLQPEDVRILKLLYLVRYVSYLETTLGNITILMVEDMGVDTVALREQVKASLSRLVRENYVARQGDKYNFLTNEEQDISRAISKMEVEPAAVVDEIKKILFDGLYTQRKLRHGANDFPFDRYVDNSLHGAAQGGMKLNVVTLADDLSRADDAELALKSSHEALVVLSSEYDYWDVLQNAAKIRKYVRTQNVSQLDPSTQEIIARKQNEASYNEKEAKTLLENAVAHARCAVNGRMEQVRATNAKQVFDQVLEKLADAVFSKAAYITAPAESDEDARRVLLGAAQTSMEGLGGSNEQACAEMRQYLEIQQATHQKPTMGDVQRKFQGEPYGWRDYDIALVAAQLIAAQEATLTYAGQKLAADDPKTVDFLRKHAEKAVLEKRVRISERLLKNASDLLYDVCQKRVSTADEDALAQAVAEELEAVKDHCAELVKNFRGLSPEFPYPGQSVIEKGLRIANQVLGHRADQEAFLRAFADAEDELLDFSEERENIDGFFPNQQRVFDESVAQLALVGKDSFYLQGNAEVQAAIAATKEILQMEEPYGSIHKLNQLQKQIEAGHSRVVQQKRNELLDALSKEREEVRTYAAQQAYPEAAQIAAEGAVHQLESLETKAHAANTASDVAALESQLQEWGNTVYARIDAAVEQAEAKANQEVEVKTHTATGEQVTRVIETTPAPAPKPKVKQVSRMAVFPRRKLSSEAEIDAYLQQVRAVLVEQLANQDSIRLG